jgi:hypothetical protein
MPQRRATSVSTHGIYASQNDSTVLGYRENNRRDRGPVCNLSVGAAGDIAADANGDLIVPGGYNVSVFSGPDMCGPSLATISMGWAGYAVDAASLNAKNGAIAVAAIQNGSGPGSIELCTISAGCGSYLRADGMNIVIGVAVGNNGDCWASWETGPSEGYAAALTYFKGCTGSGTTAKGYQNPAAGGLDIDKRGNLVSISCTHFGCTQPSVYVYSGCDPKCRLVGGPFSLKGTSTYGHLNGDSTNFVAADSQYDQVDVYKYESTALTYLYSFQKGLSNSATLTGAAYNR